MKTRIRLILPYDESEDASIFRSLSITGASFPPIVGEVYTAAGNATRNNEDAFSIVATDDSVWAAVFDGSTSFIEPVELAAKHTTAARYASHVLRDLFPGIVEQEEDPREVLVHLNSMLREKIRVELPTVSLTQANALPTSTATIAKISFAKRELSVAHVGDSFLALSFSDGTSELITPNAVRRFDKEAFSFIESIAKAEGISPRQVARDQRVTEMFLDLYRRRNNNPNGEGCGVINGDPAVKDYLFTRTLPLRSVSAILLGSDGFPPISLDIEDVGDRLEIFECTVRSGLAEMYRKKRSAEDADPDWSAYIRCKHSDDATAIFIEVPELL